MADRGGARVDEPGLERRRTRAFADELVARARAWLPDWNPDQAPGDPGRALLEVSARVLAQVAERLDRVAQKDRRNLYQWLGIRGRAARGARLPIVFKLADGAGTGDGAGVFAKSPAQLQVEAGGATLVFETEQDLQLVRATVALVVAVDPEKDAYYLPADDIGSLEPQALLPSRWEVVGLAGAGSTSLQLDPPLGLAPGMLIEVGGQPFSITALDADIVTVDPAIDVSGGVATGSIATRIDHFVPFDDGAARSRQLHALYIGHADLFNIESTAQIALVNGAVLVDGYTWEYWGKGPSSDAADQRSTWRGLTFAKQTLPNRVVLEKARAGAVDPLVVGGAQSRWIRARSRSLAGASGALTLADLKVGVQSIASTVTRPLAQPALEAFANTTPLVLDSAFLPLGREPRQFDAFYLGCAEVFAKHGAIATLTLELADATFVTLAAARRSGGTSIAVAGVGADASLHLFSFQPSTGALTALPGADALQPPGPGPSGRAALTVPPWRLPIWTDASGLVNYVAVASGLSVWVRVELLAFFGFGPVGDWRVPGSSVATSGALQALVHLPETAGEGMLIALCEGVLYARAASATDAWTRWSSPALRMIAAIDEVAPPPGGAMQPVGVPRLVGITADGHVVLVHDGGAVAAVLAMPELASPQVQPIAMRSGAVVMIVACNATRDAVMAIEETSGATAMLTVSSLNESVAGFDFDDCAAGAAIVVTLTANGASRLAWWQPDFTSAAQAVLFGVPLSPVEGVLGGAPLRMPGRVIVPGGQAAVFELQTVAPPASAQAPIELWAQLPTLAAPLQVGDALTVDRDGVKGVARIAAAEVVVGSTGYLPLGDAALVIGSQPARMLGFRTSGPASTASIVAGSGRHQIELAAGDEDVLDDSMRMLVVVGATRRLLTVTSANITKATGSQTLVSFADALPATVPDPFDYWPSVDLPDADVFSVLRFDLGTPLPPLPPTDLLRLVFSTGAPARRNAHVLTRGPSGAPATAWLDPAPTGTAPNPAAAGTSYTFRFEPTTGTWTRPIGIVDSNPELSWEYSNGRSWRGLDEDFGDTTGNLKVRGDVKFRVPADFVASDWAGRSNFWIRARLVGGDYGKEVFTVKSETTGTVTTQSSTRSTDGIRPPAVVSIAVKYAMDDAVYPDFVFAEDAGTRRNQSDANRTAGALVEAFLPLAVQLGRLDGGPGAVPGPDATAGCCPDPAEPCLPGTNEVAATVARTIAGSRAIYVGIDGVAEGTPVGLLLAVGEERDFDAAAPLAVDALVGGRFEPVVSKDATRAIGESGIVSMAIAHAPSVSELFGRTLSWLRLTPADGSDWRPSLAGAWLNAVWVDVSQTQTLEVLGSSQGAPNMMVALARPPLLHDSLELRVNEPLGDEEVDALRASDATAVLTNVEGLGGRWVRWTAVDDPADAASGARVYSVDEASGEVRFGDGLHGMIPPIGRDNVVAFRYRRTEPLAPALPGQPPLQVAVAARSALGLVTPLAGVEGAVAALDSDAGAPADDAERVLRFAPAMLRHRGRVLTPVDVEAIAMQLVPAIAQARCLRDGGALRLVIVMRGSDIAPARAVVRELRSALVAAMPPGFGTAGSGLALAIVGARPRRLRVRARLTVASLDVAGAVATLASAALRARLDPAVGGDDGLGWPIGVAPDAGTIEATLIDVANLDGIAAIDLVEISDTGERSWPATLAHDELAVLPADGFAFTYRLPETAS